MNERFQITPRDEMHLKQLYPKFANMIRCWLADCHKDKLPVHLTQSFRYYGQQDDLWRKGLTNAKGGESKHNFCLAVDYAFDNGEQPGMQDPYHEPMPGAWELAAKKAQDLGLIAGFFWKGGWDKDHIEARTKSSMEELNSIFLKQDKKGLFEYLDKTEEI